VGSFTPAEKSLFFTKNDPHDTRLGELFKSTSPENPCSPDSFVLLGYPDDEGISLNGGRTGAAQGPDKIRQFLYKMTPASKMQTAFADIGNLISAAGDLPARHRQAQHAVFKLQEQKAKTISLGGGHDYGYPDASGFLKAFVKAGQRPLILNFDAHLDVRPDTGGFNSGTPFFRLLSDPEFAGTFDFVEIGIQPQCNSLHHREWAKSKGAHIVDLKEVQQSGLGALFRHRAFSQVTKRTPVFVSFDIDALTASEAGGCSQAWVTGLKTEEFLQFFATLCQNTDVRGLGVYEVSPPLDTDNRTVKTAALIVYHFLFQENS
jgi:formiminoglutamase